MLVMQLRNEAIVQRQHEIRHLERRHEALLRALFETTHSTFKINNIQQPQRHDLESFLEFNSISRGHSFDPSSLPPTDRLRGDFGREPIDAGRPYDSVDGGQQNILGRQVRLAEEHDRENDTADGGGPSGEPHAHPSGDKSSSWIVDGSSTTAPAPERILDADGKNKQPVAEVDSSNTLTGLASDSVSPKDLGLQPHKKPPDDVNLVLPHEPQDTIADYHAENALDKHIPPEAVQEGTSGQLVQVIHDPVQERNHLEPLKQTTSEHSNFLGAQGAAVRRPTDEIEDGQSRSAEAPNSQVELAKVETLTGAVSTPDEQLRLEEAQSMHLSEAPNGSSGSGLRPMPRPASTSSDFIFGNMMDVDTGPNIPIDGKTMAEQNDSSQTAQDMQEDLSERPFTGLRDHVMSGMGAGSPEGLTLSRRPPMRIDTGIASDSDSTSAPAIKSDAVALPTPSELTTPNKSTAVNVQSQPERMTTRVSSGALRHKSVSEILGETPKSIQAQVDKTPLARSSEDTCREDQSSLQTPQFAISFTSPDPATFKLRLTELREKEKSKLSTVTFASSRNPDVTQACQQDESGAAIKNRDYLLTLFNCQVLSPPRAQHLNSLVKSAHKTLSTADHSVDFSERQACRVLSKIYELQAKNSWSLRQIERSAEPKRPLTHQDVLLSEMKWMRTDFREERKWKMAAAKFTADACAVWCTGDAEERRSLQVKIRVQPAQEKTRPDSVSTPDLIHSTDDEVSEMTDEDGVCDPGSAPAAIFSLPPEMFIFGLKHSPVAEKLLLELPLYEPNVEVQNSALRMADLEPDSSWKKDLIPISKFAEGKIVPTSDVGRGRARSCEEGPPLKRSRFDYHSTDLRQPDLGASNVDGGKILEPEQDDVALFDQEYKHIRDRIHTGHAFRPPSEYIMPSQSFFESRSSSQWTQAEDDELRRIVKEYSYNWSLISSSLTLPSKFTSGAERRTPWECFERWISLEGLPVEMAKINYFRAYHARLQAAQKTVERMAHQQQQQQQQQQQGGGAKQQPFRRRTTQPYSVERRKDQKHLHLIDAMRKLAKKREAQLNKQQHVASLAAMRKTQEGPKSRKEMHTPQEFSRIKYNQQLKLQEQARQYNVQVMQHQKAAQAARANQQAGQQANGNLPSRNPVPGVPNGSSPNMTAANPHRQVRGNARDPSQAALQMQRMVNGQTNGVPTTNSHGVPHAPMQPTTQVPMQIQQRVPPVMAPDSRLLQEASRVQAQQHAYQQQIRQSGHPPPNGHSASPSMQNPNLLPQSNAAVLASVQGRSSPSLNGVVPPTGPSTSPRTSQPQALSSGMTPAVNHISSQVKARHPQASPEQITRMTTDQLYKMSEARHHAMQAAAGNTNMNAVASNSSMGLQAPSPLQQAAMMSNGGSPILNPAHYAQIMRTQQASQQRSANVNNLQGPAANSVNINGVNSSSMGGAGKSGSRSVTPLIQRTSSAQDGSRPSQSPSARPVGLAQ